MQADCLCVGRKALVQVLYHDLKLLDQVILLFVLALCLSLHGKGFLYIYFNIRWRPYSGEGWTMGCAGMVVDLGHKTAECGGYPKGPLAKIWKKLLYQVIVWLSEFHKKSLSHKNLQH